jgi:hypothetical protein
MGENSCINANIQEVGGIFVSWIDLAKNRDHWREVKDIVMKRRVQ